MVSCSLFSFMSEHFNLTNGFQEFIQSLVHSIQKAYLDLERKYLFVWAQRSPVPVNTLEELIEGCLLHI